MKAIQDLVGFAGNRGGQVGASAMQRILGFDGHGWTGENIGICEDAEVDIKKRYYDGGRQTHDARAGAGVVLLTPITRRTTRPVWMCA